MSVSPPTQDGQCLAVVGRRCMHASSAQYSMALPVVCMTLAAFWSTPARMCSGTFGMHVRHASTFTRGTRNVLQGQSDNVLCVDVGRILVVVFLDWVCRDMLALGLVLLHCCGEGLWCLPALACWHCQGGTPPAACPENLGCACG
jgi:hypothetical protein